MRRHEGFLIVNKSRGATSFDVIRKMRNIFSCKRIGHAGTLDPDASGILILAFGQATRLLQYLISEPKIYQFTLSFGSETDTLDSSGNSIFSGGRMPSAEDIVTVLYQFTGVQQQIPPAFSAVKVNGKRAYALARKGVTPALASREITVFAIRMLDCDEAAARASFEVSCSGGTYVRALARDIARALGTFAHTTSIHRSACGKFTTDTSVVDSAVTFDTALLSIPEALDHLPVVETTDHLRKEVSFGRDIILADIPKEATEVLAMDQEHFTALLKRTTEEVFHPSIVCVPEKEDEGD